MQIGFVETIVFTDLVQSVKPYKTRRKVITVSPVCMVSLLVFMASRVALAL